MPSITQLLGSLIATLLVYGVYRLIKFTYAELTSPLRDLPGPKSSSFMYGNLKDIWDAENSVLHEQWVQEYGNTIKYKGLFGMNRLYTTDLKALNHVLMNSNDYQKPEAARHNLSHIVGPGVLVVEGEKHRQQRRIMNPAFGPSQIRELTPIFIEKSIQLRDVLASQITNKEEPARVDVLSPLSKTTLDVIGLAGFNYKFDALSGRANELNEAFSTIFGANSRMSLVPILRAWFPFLRWLRVEHDAEVKRARQTMARIGEQLLHDSKQAVRGTNEKESWRNRDLLSILIRANMATDLPESQRMSDGDVLAQVPTFLVAGHETTSTATTWALYALTQSPDVQRKLREELFTIDTDNPTMDELNALPYLDYVVRETLRVHAPVPSTIRIATNDDVLPLNNPVTDLKGKVHHDLHVKKGQTMLIPLLAINRDKSIWGEDAKEFRPERWKSPPEAANQIPGVWGNLMSFLGGPRACIGYRFSLVETKALLFTLVRAFEFELAVPAEDIGKKSSIVQRPIIRSDPQAGNQMPLLIKHYNHV